MSEKRRALGRGLGALIPSGAPAADRPVDVFFRDQDAGQPTQTSPGQPGPAAFGPGDDAGQAPVDHAEDVASASPPHGEHDLRPVPGAEFAEIPLDQIRPNPRQPRTAFDEDELAELVHSIREIGVLQPVVVRRVPHGTAADGVRYELIMGERRWRASREAGKEVVPAIIKATEEDDLLRDALLENLHRSQLNALEEAAAYQQLLDDFGCTQEELARRIGRSRPQISNTLRLLKLPPLVQRRVAAGVLSAGHARALLGLPDAGAMERMAQRVVAEGLSVRTVEELVTVGDGTTPPARRAPRAGARRPQLDDLAADLSDRLETRVRIALGQRKGRLTVEFASVEDLNRILDAMHLRDGREG
ncbi:hypothetical protein GCM10023168_27180 [Fodinibacter luteus]|uniref:ParB-like N-terminal domain-containing protein n=1 Tax=Fodinibacter luteus TaxID=552064 RepID=A0ABP8KK61_9MICO